VARKQIRPHQNIQYQQEYRNGIWIRDLSLAATRAPSSHTVEYHTSFLVIRQVRHADPVQLAKDRFAFELPDPVSAGSKKVVCLLASLTIDEGTGFTAKLACC